MEFKVGETIDNIPISLISNTGIKFSKYTSYGISFNDLFTIIAFLLLISFLNIILFEIIIYVNISLLINKLLRIIKVKFILVINKTYFKKEKMMFRLILFFLKINFKITLVTLIIILSYTGIIILDFYINFEIIENMKSIYFNLNALLIIIS